MSVFEDRKSVSGTAAGAVAESVEVASVGRRRTFSAEYKRRILDEADRAGPGELGLLLRREGLYSSHLSNWRTGRRGMTRKSRVKKSSGKSGTDRRLEKENARLKLKLAKAEAMLELQKKASAIWAMEDERSETDS